MCRKRAFTHRKDVGRRRPEAKATSSIFPHFYRFGGVLFDRVIVTLAVQAVTGGERAPPCPIDLPVSIGRPSRLMSCAGV